MTHAHEHELAGGAQVHAEHSDEHVEHVEHVEHADHAESVDVAVHRALGTLRTGGNRITDARRAVIEALAQLDEHPSAEQLGEAVQRVNPGVHRATVYRTLDTLVALGVASHVHVSGGATAYHLTPDAVPRTHMHARCTGCGRIIDLPADLLDAVTSRLRDEADFELDPAHVALSGLCSRCRTAQHA